MATAHHGRDQIAYVTMGANRDGTFKGLHVKIIADFGAYMMLLTPSIPSLGAFVMAGCYKWDAVRTDITGVMTNKMATDAIRGAGRPGGHPLHRGHHRPAGARARAWTGSSCAGRTSSRRRTSRPRPPLGVVYDSGNYHGTLAKLLEHFDPEAERGETADGKLRGVGFSTWTEICGLAPSRATGPSGFGVQAGPDGVRARARPRHRRGTVYTGTSPHGQGLETSFAQIVADKLGLDPQAVDVMHGDTSQGPWGLDTYGSRSLAVGGEAIARASDKVVDKAQGDRRPQARGRARGHRARTTARSPSRARRTRA